MSSVISTSRVPRVASGQAGSRAGGCRIVCTPWTTSGRDGSSASLDDALHAQQLLAMRRAQQVEEHLDRRERHRPVMHQREGLHPRVVAMLVIVVMIVVVIAMVVMVVCALPRRASAARRRSWSPDRRGRIRTAPRTPASGRRHRASRRRGLMLAQPRRAARRALARSSTRSALVMHDAVGDGDLLHRLDMGVERRLAVDRIDQRDHAVEPVGLRPAPDAP